MRRGGGAGPLVLVLVLFSVLAALVYVNNQNPEIRRINSVAQQYADAWRNGNLDSIDYDLLSHSSVLDDSQDRQQVDPGKVAENVQWITNDLDGKGELRPEKIEVDRSQTQRSGKANDLASTRLWVTWKLQPAGLDQSAHFWTYAVTLQERLLDGRWRVVWSPESVHPAIRHGLVFRVNRSQPPRAGLLGAGDTQLWPVQQGQPQLAPAVIGRIVNRATYEESRLADLRAKPGDTLGVAGLQDLYDERLAGGARIEITAGVVQGYSPGITPTQQPLFVGAPDTPKPLKVSLDRRTQLAAEAALPTTATPATVVVVKASTGELLAAANTGPAGTTTDYALSAQQPAGPVFGLASTLALLRSPAASQQTQEPYQLTTRIDCSEPFTVGGQVFRNPQGPRLAGVQLGAAVEGGCTTGLARAAADVRPETLQTAAYDLGLATPLQPTAGAPGLLTVADQLGIPAFHGTVPPTADAPARDAVNHAQNMTGEGQVLVSPLSMARAAATVSSGTRRSVRLIVDPAPRNADAPKDLPAHEVEALRVLLAKGVSESGGTAHALASLGDVHALAGTAGYGTGAPQTRQAWCVGYLGDYAFAVLVPNGVTSSATTAAPPAGFTNPAVTIASKFLTGIR